MSDAEPGCVYKFHQSSLGYHSDNSLDISKLYGIMERGFVGGFNWSTKYPTKYDQRV